MKVTARVTNSTASHHLVVATNGTEKALRLAPKVSGRGSSINGGELLLAALATCMCNDLYREAAKRTVSLDTVEVEVEAVFPAEGEPANDVEYHVTISGAADGSVLRDLVRSTDAVAEVQNTVRAAIPVKLGQVLVVARGSGPTALEASPDPAAASDDPAPSL